MFFVSLKLDALAFNLSGFFDSKYMNYKNTNVNELGLKLNYELDNFGADLISRFFDKNERKIEYNLYYFDDYQKLEIGNNLGIIKYVKNHHFSSDKDYFFYYNNINNLLTIPTLLSSQNFSFLNNIDAFYYSKRVEKITYKNNYFNDLVFGFSYIDNYKLSCDKKIDIGKILQYGFNKAIKFDNFEISGYFLGENILENVYKSNSYEIGAGLNYLSYSAGLSYGFGNENIISQIFYFDKKRKEYNYFNFNFGYEISSFNFNFDYMFSKTNTAKLNNYSLNLDYKINKNLLIYSLMSYVNFNDLDNRHRNDIIFGVGLLVKF